MKLTKVYKDTIKKEADIYNLEVVFECPCHFKVSKNSLDTEGKPLVKTYKFENKCLDTSRHLFENFEDIWAEGQIWDAWVEEGDALIKKINSRYNK